MKNLTFYSDSSVLGGHEIMTIEIMKVLKDYFNINVILSRTNVSFEERLKKDDIKYTLIDYRSSIISFVTNRIRNKIINEIKDVLIDHNTDILVLIQGNIDISLIGVIASKQLNIYTVSYIPLTQPLARVSKYKFIGLIKDFFRKRSYSLPDSYITISNSQKSNLKEIVPHKRVEIIPNFVERVNKISTDKIDIRRNYGLPLDKYIVAYIGRFEAWHKGLDRFCKYLEFRASSHSDKLFLFIGNGTFKKQLLDLANKNSNILVWDWMENLEDIYSMIDAVIMPSRYEGVSLTMLEALYHKLPVLANEIPEFREFIPQRYLFNLYDFDSIESKLNSVINSPNNRIQIASEEVVTKERFKDYTIAVFKKIMQYACTR